MSAHELFLTLDRLAEAVMVDLADTRDDEEVPIGRLLIELFDADERGYDYPADFRDLRLTAGEIRSRMRRAREDLIATEEAEAAS